MSRDWRAEYFDRVRPALDPLFFERRVALWDLGFGWHIAEALARTGLRKQVWLDGREITTGDAVARSFGAGLAGERRADALAQRCAAHNRFEDDWAFEHRERDVAELRRALAASSRCDLLLARIDEHAPQVCRAAIDAGVPLVMSLVPAGAALGCLQLVWTPQARVDPRAVVDLCADLASVAALDLDRPESHVEGLEARSLALALARWLLAPDSPERPDLRQSLLEEGRVVVLRGQPGWPWDVRFVRPGAVGLRRLVADRTPRYQPPLALVGRGQRLLVLGLGTASLLCAEAAALGARQLVFVDCKAVSPENPVRQIYATDRIGQPKGGALVETLAHQLGPDAAWQQRRGAAVTWLEAGDLALGHAELRLRRADRASVARFEAILDEVQPTLAVVAMGRSRDDNFIATAALRRRGIRHITPTAFPGLSHFKHILTDGARGPCYDCLQGHLAVDSGAGPTLSAAERALFYGGTQPATLAETYPSAHSLLRLARDLSLPPAARPPYLQAQLAAERNCLVGANRTERVADGWLYGVDHPFKLVSYGIEDLVGSRTEEHCPCGRVNRVRTIVG